MNISQLMLTNSARLIVAIAATVFVFIAIFTIWRFVASGKKEEGKKSKPSKSSDPSGLLFNDDGSLKTYDRDFEDLARQVNNEEQKKSLNQMLTENGVLDEEEDDDVDLLQEIYSKDSLGHVINSLEDVPMSTMREQQKAFDEEFFEMSKFDADEEDDSSIKRQLQDLSPEMKAIVFTSLLDRKDY